MERLFFPYTAKEAQKAGVHNYAELNRESVFASRLRDLRNQDGISQAALAEDLGIVKSTIGLYETGDTVPDARTIKKYAEYFNVSADWLLGLSDFDRIDANERAACEYLGISQDLAASILYAEKNHPALTKDPESFMCHEGINRFEYLLENFVNSPWMMDSFMELCKVISEAIADVNKQDSSLTSENSTEGDNIQFKRFLLQKEVMKILDRATGYSHLDIIQNERWKRGFEKVLRMNEEDRNSADIWRLGYGK